MICVKCIGADSYGKGEVVATPRQGLLTTATRIPLCRKKPLVPLALALSLCPHSPSSLIRMSHTK